MKRFAGARSTLIQVAALAVFAVLASQIVTLVVVITSPPPRPQFLRISAMAEALTGAEAQTSDGRRLVRRLSDEPHQGAGGGDPLTAVIGGLIARSLDVPADRVRVSMDRGLGSPFGRRDFILADRSSIRRPSDIAAVTTMAGKTTLNAWESADGMAVTTLPAPRDRMRIVAAEGQLRLLNDRLAFPPFSASLRLDDGRWATVRPPRDLIEPWQARLLISLAISLLLLAPLVWLMARRLTRPIRAFALAAERLGADPDAEPLSPTGPTEVRTAVHAFNDMQTALKGHIVRRTQTVAAIAHDLRTPLTRLRFRAEQSPPEVRDRMAADIEEMDALIAQALAYVRGEAPPERREPFDLADLAADCAGGFSETGAKVTFAGADPLPVRGDVGSLRRALGNLIGNAVKYAGSARVQAARHGERALILIDDDGPALPADDLEAVFEPFHRAERSRNRETGGAGLGLTVARQAARAHGGDVTLENRPEGGLRARLSLPIDSPAS